MPVQHTEPNEPADQRHQDSNEPASTESDMLYMSTESLTPNVPKRTKQRPPAASATASAHEESSADHPAMNEIPLLEKYMKLRASGHHVSEEEEALIMQAMLSRVAQVEDFESTDSNWAAGTRGALDDEENFDPLLRRSRQSNAVEAADDPELAELARTPAEALTQEFVQTTTLSSIHTQRAPQSPASGPAAAPLLDSDPEVARVTTQAHAHGGAHFTGSKADTFQDQQTGEQMAGVDLTPQGRRKQRPDRGLEALGTFPGVPEARVQAAGIPGRTYQEIIRWYPKRREADEDAEKQDTVLRRLSFETHVALGLPSDFSDATKGLPAFLMDASDGSDEASSTAAATSGPHGDQVYSGQQFQSKGKKPRRHARHEEELFRFGVIGLPNAGKSTVTNWLAGGTISAVSVRPETTRRPFLGVFTRNHKQVVLYDTPGMHGTQDFRTRSESMRVGASWQHSLECGSLGLIVDAYRFVRSGRKSKRRARGKAASKSASTDDLDGEDSDSDDDASTTRSRDHRAQVFELAEAIGSKRGPPGFTKGWEQRPAVLLVNKCDLLISHPSELLAIPRQLSRACEFSSVFFVSAENGAGMPALRGHLLDQCQPEEWEFESHQPSDQTWPQLTAELVREKLYWAHGQEVPYKLRPVCDTVEDGDDGKVHAFVDIPVSSHRYKEMVEGKQRGRTKRIEVRVGAELAHMMKRHVKVHVRVKVKKNQHLPPMEL